MTFREEVKGKRVLLFGLGEQGGGSGDAKWLVQAGAFVRVTDKRTKEVLQSVVKELPESVEMHGGGHSREDIDWADVIIKNPGVADDEGNIVYAKKRGKQVLTSIAVFVREGRDITIGVTGTRGKSTTTELVYTLLNTAFPGVVIRGGNIPGTSGLQLLDELGRAKFAVLELSSFQLHNFHELKVSPHIAVVTNIYPDHLNRYKNMTDYMRDKEAILMYQKKTDIAVIGDDNVSVQEMKKGVVGQLVTYSAHDVQDWDAILPGAHNRENIAAMRAVARVLDIPDESTRRVAATFKGVPFRFEKIREVAGISYINDTTATTPIAATKAVEAVAAPTVLICGGASKNLPYDELVKTLEQSKQVKHIVLLGSREIPDFVAALTSAVGSRIVGQVGSVQEAVDLARSYAKPGWNVLLSPGFSSFDLFKNEFDRGRQFNEVVLALSP